MQLSLYIYIYMYMGTMENYSKTSFSKHRIVMDDFNVHS